jgi:hypothetical protein
MHDLIIAAVFIAMMVLPCAVATMAGKDETGA